MRNDKIEFQRLKELLRKFSQTRYSLPGIETEADCNSFCRQIISSLHRIGYIHLIRKRDISSLRANPQSELFDPIKAAIFHHRNGDMEESFWLVFLSIHFGMHSKDGWRLTRDIYGRLGNKTYWNWKNISSNINDFRNWLGENQNNLSNDGISRRFGNHRKYESLNAWSNAGTGSVVESYVAWVETFGSHQKLILNAKKEVGENPGLMFDHLYQSMRDVQRFGRLGRFDYLTMIGKLGLAEIEPRSLYMQGATGPMRGAKLLLGGNLPIDISICEFDRRLVELGDYLNVGTQVMEDSLCNWQKRPDLFIPFRG